LGSWAAARPHPAWPATLPQLETLCITNFCIKNPGDIRGGMVGLKQLEVAGCQEEGEPPRGFPHHHDRNLLYYEILYNTPGI
jgi:hypothetical protein